MKQVIVKHACWLVALALSAAQPMLAQPSEKPQPPQQPSYELRVTPATQPAGQGNTITLSGGGIITARDGSVTLTADNINLSRDYRLAVELLSNDQKVRGAYLGVGVEAPNATLRAQLKLPEGVGLVVNYVDEKGPSHGVIRQHDVLEKLDDQLLVNAEQLVTLVRLRAPGAAAQVTLVRESRPMTVTVKLAEKEQPPLSNYIQWQGQSVLDQPASPEQQAVLTWMYRDPVQPTRIMGVYGSTQPTTQPAAPGHGIAIGDVPGPSQPTEVVVYRSVAATTQPGVTDSYLSQWVVDLNAVTAAGASHAGPITLDDGEMLMWLQRGAAGGAELTVVDRATGKVSFKGPVGTDEQWGNVPEEVRKKLEAWKSALEQAPKAEKK